MPGPGIEPRPAAWQADVLTTIHYRASVITTVYHQLSLPVVLPVALSVIASVTVCRCSVVTKVGFILIHSGLLTFNLFHLLPSRWCRRFSPWQPSVLCQWPSLGWCHRYACHFSICQAISSLDVLWVGFPSPSCSTCFLLHVGLFPLHHMPIPW